MVGEINATSFRYGCSVQFGVSHIQKTGGEQLTNYLIPYVDPKKLKGHMDPVFEEFTYGEIRQGVRYCVTTLAKEVSCSFI